MVRDKVLTYCSLLLTPLVLFIIPGVNLSHERIGKYFFESSPFLFIPFLALAILCFLLGLLIFKFKKTKVLYYYITLGFTFLIYLSVKSLTEYNAFCALIFLIPIFIPQRFRNINFQYVSFITIILTVHTMVQLIKSNAWITDISKMNSKLVFENVKKDTPSINTRKFPNIYHIVLDEIPNIAFEKYLDSNKNVYRDFDGFRTYSNTITNYSFTLGSIISIFRGKLLKDNDSINAELDETFKEGVNFSQELKKNGYSTYFVNSLTPSINADFLIDYINFKHDNKIFENYHANKIIIALTLYLKKYVPFFESHYYWPNLFPYRPIKEISGFKKFTALEKTFSPHSRYNFLYLSIPHFPYFLDKSCDRTDYLKSTSHQQAIECSLFLVQDFIQELKRLGRYDDSIILIHSDHGAHLELKNINIQNPMFLIKPAHSTDFKENTTPIELLDIAPTLLHLAGTQIPKDYEGQNIFDLNYKEKEERDFFYLYPFFKGDGVWYKVNKEKNLKGFGEIYFVPIFSEINNFSQ